VKRNTGSYLNFAFIAASLGSRPLLSSHAFSLLNGTRCNVVAVSSTVNSSTPSSPNHVGLANLFETKRSGFEHCAGMHCRGVSDAA
jgi:hypothetical protein